MTVQIDDKFDYLNNEFSIIGIENGPLFEPSDYGFSPIALSSACWRGHYCKYSIENGFLILSQLNIGLETVNPPVWRGIKASGGDRKFDWTYEGVNLLIDYSGGIIIGRNLFEEFFNIFGFYHPHCFQHTIELIFEKGKILKEVVHDEYMDKAREMIRKSRQIVKKSIGYYEGTQTVTIKMPNQTDAKSFALLVKEIASKFTNLSTISLFNNFRSKGYIELDRKLYYGEYRELASCFKTKGYKNIVLTAYSTDFDTHLALETVIVEQPDSEQLLKLYDKYNYSNIFLL
ncbi:MAG TPA: hypothetical protein VF941_01365 [Clostridia bacterium]